VPTFVTVRNTRAALQLHHVTDMVMMHASMNGYGRQSKLMAPARVIDTMEELATAVEVLRNSRVCAVEVQMQNKSQVETIILAVKGLDDTEQVLLLVRTFCTACGPWDLPKLVPGPSSVF
jgi:hypothetical protein